MLDISLVQIVQDKVQRDFSSNSVNPVFMEIFYIKLILSSAWEI